jgi:hypothetical protein
MNEYDVIVIDRSWPSEHRINGLASDSTRCG